MRNRQNCMATAVTSGEITPEEDALLDNSNRPDGECLGTFSTRLSLPPLLTPPRNKELESSLVPGSIGLSLLSFLFLEKNKLETFPLNDDFLLLAFANNFQFPIVQNNRSFLIKPSPELRRRNGNRFRPREIPWCYIILLRKHLAQRTRAPAYLPLFLTAPIRCHQSPPFRESFFSLSTDRGLRRIRCPAERGREWAAWHVMHAIPRVPRHGRSGFGIAEVTSRILNLRFTERALLSHANDGFVPVVAAEFLAHLARDCFRDSSRLPILVVFYIS
ncbi:hypothetical protein STAS_23080 [Striga asiatica]|uniref:Uncharacterized protein n=1 Tax=Striga asiatica TaxID=4170 RepID=A0A5A7QLH4_STRAF|nr:hypothetical protein STAS_23080 [Striga asiatica]